MSPCEQRRRKESWYRVSNQRWASGSILEYLLRFWVGIKWLAFLMPMDLSWSIIALSRFSQGWLCTMWSSDWKYRKSYGMLSFEYHV